MLRGMGTETVADERLAVIGLGYVGLPLALDLAEAGHRVLGVDASERRLEQLRRGASYIDDVDDARIVTAVENGSLLPASPDVDWTDATAAFICVPTPVTSTREPDLGPIRSAAAYVRRGLRSGDLVVLQSTTYPGTTMGPLREILEEGGLTAGVDFDLAFSPERVSPGEGRPSSSIPRLVGGISESATARTAAILRQVSPSVMEMSSADAAELAKLFENVFRNVNIALVNELALICERLGLDVWEIIGGASTKPFGFMSFYPGPGVGGHCIPVDPYYLAARAREVGFHERFIETAGDINSRMPEHVVSLVSSALNSRGKAVRGSSVLLIGVAFKQDVSDDRNSPARPIARELMDAGARVSYHDPYLAHFGLSEDEDADAAELASVDLAEALAAAPDCVVVVTPHSGVDWDRVFDSADLIVDTRNASGGRRVRPGQVLRLGGGWS